VLGINVVSSARYGGSNLRINWLLDYYRRLSGYPVYINCVVHVLLQPKAWPQAYNINCFYSLHSFYIFYMLEVAKLCWNE
jgi:hypothetical protein